MLPVVSGTASDGKNVADIDPEFFYDITCKKLCRRLRAAKIIWRAFVKTSFKKGFFINQS
jgi:hypothetical protein